MSSPPARPRIPAPCTTTTGSPHTSARRHPDPLAPAAASAGRERRKRSRLTLTVGGAFRTATTARNGPPLNRAAPAPRRAGPLARSRATRMSGGVHRLHPRLLRGNGDFRVLCLWPALGQARRPVPRTTARRSLAGNSTRDNATQRLAVPVESLQRMRSRTSRHALARDVLLKRLAGNRSRFLVICLFSAPSVTIGKMDCEYPTNCQDLLRSALYGE